jgi:hypothetical protein
MPCSQATFMGQIDSCVCPILHTLKLMLEILSSITLVPSLESKELFSQSNGFVTVLSPHKRCVPRSTI